MDFNWTFGRKLAVGFATVVAFTVVIGVVANLTLANVVASKDRVIQRNGSLAIGAWRLKATDQTVGALTRGYLLTGDPETHDRLYAARDELTDELSRLRLDFSSAEGAELLNTIEAADAELRSVADGVIVKRASGVDLTSIVTAFEANVVPARQRLDAALDAMIAREVDLLESARLASTETANTAASIITVLGLIAALAAAGVAIYLARLLNRQIGAAVRNVQSASAELQSAASQQANGVREQVSSMSEITSTINELLATSRQIAHSAQRVAQISAETTTAANSGDGTVERATDSIGGIRRQVDLVVGHMLDLGRKSQEIGAVLDIVTELAEQTNILSINATIEAAGAGEEGRRFAVVAEEIRKLADRVGGSAKEIRTLIDDVRSSVNTTVMATETGSKSVDNGAREFGDVATVFKEIARLVAVTTEAAREIELSTKQQASAVEQVNVAIASVAQATRETEASAGQTIQTAGELAATSRSLLRLVQARAAA